jgi:hypothetical protein
MDKATAYRAHPGFVDIIKNMCPDEARVMRFLGEHGRAPIVDIRSTSNTDHTYYVVSSRVTLVGGKAECEHPLLIATYLDNLERLGLLHVDMQHHLSAPALYAEIEDHPEVKKVMESLNALEGRKGTLAKGIIGVTSLGNQFIRACVLDKEGQLRN